ncbi:MAG: hypothetical protein IJD04_07940 [Desulfovibrionaceae bacterium]|nr:hypothetical protein [Desulfovibrionaceae bacterium]
MPFVQPAGLAYRHDNPDAAYAQSQEWANMPKRLRNTCFDAACAHTQEWANGLGQARRRHPDGEAVEPVFASDFSRLGKKSLGKCTNIAQKWSWRA